MTLARTLTILWIVAAPFEVSAAPSENLTSRATDKQPIAVSVEFDAPEGCSDRANFESGLRARFERIKLVPVGSASWAIRVRVVPLGNGVHGELRLSDGHGESDLRAVEGADCSGVVDALSLTAALAIEQTVALVESTKSSGSSGSNSDSQDPSVPTDSKNKSDEFSTNSLGDVPADDKTKKGTDDESSTFQSYVGTFAIPLVRPLISFGASVELRYRATVTASFRPVLALGAQYVPVEFLQLKNNIGVDYRGLSFLVCPAQLRLGQLIQISPCLTTDIGRLTVSSRQVEVSTPSRRLQAYGGMEGRIGILLTRGVELEMRSGIRVPTVNRKYVRNEPATDLGSSPSLSWLMGLGISVSF